MAQVSLELLEQVAKVPPVYLQNRSLVFSVFYFCDGWSDQEKERHWSDLSSTSDLEQDPGSLATSRCQLLSWHLTPRALQRVSTASQEARKVELYSFSQPRSYWNLICHARCHARSVPCTTPSFQLVLDTIVYSWKLIRAPSTAHWRFSLYDVQGFEAGVLDPAGVHENPFDP